MVGLDGWYGLHTPLGVSIHGVHHSVKSYENNKNQILLFDTANEIYVIKSIRDACRYAEWDVSGAEFLLQDFIQYVDKNKTSEEKFLRRVSDIAAGSALTEQIARARALSPYHTSIFLFACFLVLNREASFQCVKWQQNSLLKDISEWSNDRLLFLKSLFEIRYGGLDARVINNAVLLVNHVLPLAETQGRGLYSFSNTVSSVTYCVDKIYTNLKNSVALTNRVGEFVLASTDQLEQFSAQITNLADRAV